MQQPEKSAAEAKAQRSGGLRLEQQRGIVQLQLHECVAQLGELLAVYGIKSAENHRFDRFVAGQGLVCRAVSIGDGIAHARIADGFDACCQVTYLPRAQFIALL